MRANYSVLVQHEQTIIWRKTKSIINIGLIKILRCLPGHQLASLQFRTRYFLWFPFISPAGLT